MIGATSFGVHVQPVDQKYAEVFHMHTKPGKKEDHMLVAFPTIKREGGGCFSMVIPKRAADSLVRGQGNFDFGSAMNLLKSGFGVRRVSWPPEVNVIPEYDKNGTIYVLMKVNVKGLKSTYNPTHLDLLADDWAIVFSDIAKVEDDLNPENISE